MPQTGFYTDERTFWAGGGCYAGLMKVEGLVQPSPTAGLPENPETKRRLLNLAHVTGLARDMDITSADPATRADLLRVHPALYLDAFRALSDSGGGELGLRAPFGPGGYDIAALSAGLSIAAVANVLKGHHRNAYALSRPPGHHCLADQPMGFCQLANGALAIRAAQAAGLAQRFVVLDWDVHHGNGTEAIFYDDPDVLTISLHQENNFPLNKGLFGDRGTGAGLGANLNIPLPPGTGHKGYLEVMDRIVAPAISAHRPDAIIVACGFDAGVNDPLGRMLATAETFRLMTRAVMALADHLCGGRLILIHEGGYSETYVPFCGHAVLEELTASRHTAPDPMAATFAARQPGPAFDRFLSGQIDEWVAALRAQGAPGF